MPFTKNWMHLAWPIKQQGPLLTPEARRQVCMYIKENAPSKGIHVDCVNGEDDHIHMLVLLGVNMTVNKMVEVLKGDTAFWINKQRLVKGKFEWHDEYFAVSVSESGVGAIRSYINNQQALHQRKSFRDECLEFMSRYGFKRGK